MQGRQELPENKFEDGLRKLKSELILARDGVSLMMGEEWGTSEEIKGKLKPSADKFLEAIQELQEKLREINF